MSRKYIIGDRVTIRVSFFMGTEEYMRPHTYTARVAKVDEKGRVTEITAKDRLISYALNQLKNDFVGRPMTAEMRILTEYKAFEVVSIPGI